MKICPTEIAWSRSNTTVRTTWRNSINVPSIKGEIWKPVTAADHKTVQNSEVESLLMYKELLFYNRER